jgi:hypothetical protein
MEFVCLFCLCGSLLCEDQSDIADVSEAHAASGFRAETCIGSMSLIAYVDLPLRNLM